MAALKFNAQRNGFGEELELFRCGARGFVEAEILPHNDEWERAGMIDKKLFARAGSAGYLAFDAPEEFGGGGVRDFRFNAIFFEEACRAGVSVAASGLQLHNDICLPYYLEATNDEQKRRWLPGICDGTLVTAVAMTEPGTGSDLAAIKTTAVRKGDHYVLNGTKMFISSGLHCDLVIVACSTDPSAGGRGLSLIVVDTNTPGFKRGRKLDKIGQRSADTAELIFDNVKAPVENLLGEEGQGFAHLVTKLPRERLSLAIGAVAQAEAAFVDALQYAKDRSAFGQPIGSFQHNRFALATMRTELDIAQVFVDRQIEALNQGILTAETAAEAKWWCTELCKRVVDQCLQLYGGYGYMEEYPIARAYRDTRILTIAGGTTEIMKEVIGRSLGV